jgi:hypothetical protein
MIYFASAGFKMVGMASGLRVKRTNKRVVSQLPQILWLNRVW